MCCLKQISFQGLFIIGDTDTLLLLGNLLLLLQTSRKTSVSLLIPALNDCRIGVNILQNFGNNCGLEFLASMIYVNVMSDDPITFRCVAMSTVQHFLTLLERHKVLNTGNDPFRNSGSNQKCVFEDSLIFITSSNE